LGSVVAHPDDLGGDDVREAAVRNDVLRTDEDDGDAELVYGNARAGEDLVGSVVTADRVECDREHVGIRRAAELRQSTSTA
jgi:hypothetical protein